MTTFPCPLTCLSSAQDRGPGVTWNQYHVDCITRWRTMGKKAKHGSWNCMYLYAACVPACVRCISMCQTEHCIRLCIQYRCADASHNTGHCRWRSFIFQIHKDEPHLGLIVSKLQCIGPRYVSWSIVIHPGVRFVTVDSTGVCVCVYSICDGINKT